MKPIPYARQDISDADVKAVVEVLSSDYLTQGPMVQEFEQAVAAYCGARHAVAVNSATSALHIACLSLDLGKGDALWTSPNTFVASANCGLYCGADVDFIDIDKRTYNLCVTALKRKLGEARDKGCLPKVVIPVHFAGQSCDMADIHNLSKEYGFSVIEDASHALGGQYKGTSIGSCRFSDMTVLSFHPVKIMTTGEGGMILTNRTDLYERLLLLRSHGITRNAAQMTEESQGPWYYQQIGLGFNYRMTDIHAALGISQLTRVEEFVKRRHAIAARYDAAFLDTPVLTPWQHQDSYSAYHLYVIRIPASTGKNRREVFEALRAAGVGVNVHYIPVHLQPYYRKFGFSEGNFPEAEHYYQEAISLPMYYGLTNEEQDYVIEKVRGMIG